MVNNKFLLFFFFLLFNNSYAVNIKNIDIELLFDKRICFYPGSFDPIHKGHEALANKCLNDENFDYVLVSVGGQPSSLKPNVTSSYHQREMVESVFRDNPKVITFLGTARELQEYIKPYIDKLYFTGLVGSDLFLKHLMDEKSDLHFMKGEPIPENDSDYGFASARVVAVKEFIVNMRSGDNLNLISGSCTYDGREIIRFLNNDNEFHNTLSSTFIREMYKEGNISILAKYLDKKIIKYIEENNIF